MPRPTILGSVTQDRGTGTLTPSHTVPAGTGALLVYVSWDDFFLEVPSVTWGSNPIEVINCNPSNLRPVTYLLLNPTPGTHTLTVTPHTLSLFNSIACCAVNIGNYAGIRFADWAGSTVSPLSPPLYTPVMSIHTESTDLVLSFVAQITSGATFTPVDQTLVFAQDGFADSSVKIALGKVNANSSYTTTDWTLTDYHRFQCHIIALKSLDGVPAGAPYALGPVTNSFTTDNQPAGGFVVPPQTGQFWQWWHTVPSTHRTLVVLLQWADGSTPVTSVTFGGVALTDFYSPGNGRAMFVLDNAPIGTFLIEVQQGTAHRTFMAGAYSLASAGIVATNSQNSIFKTITVDSTAGDIAIALVDYNDQFEPYAYVNGAAAAGSTLLFNQPVYFNSNTIEGNRPNVNGTRDAGLSVYTVATGATASPEWTADIAPFTLQIAFSFTPLPPPVFTSEPLIPRRLRRMPHLSHEQLWTFYSEFQVYLEAGLGLTAGAMGDPVQGENPQLMLRWSDDGGHTWSDEHWVGAGRKGEYAFRSLWRRLGRSRDRVFEVTVSDPIPWNLVEAYLEVEGGTS